MSSKIGILLLLPFFSMIFFTSNGVTRFPIGLDECGKSRACWATSPGTIRRWRFEKNKLRVEMQAQPIAFNGVAPGDAQWMAMAFSDDSGMGNDTVFTCIFGAEGGYRAEISYNHWTDNIPLIEASKKMISGQEFSANNGLLGCAFTVDYSQKPASMNEQKMILYLNGKTWWHVLFAQGSATRKTGQKDIHMVLHKSEQLVRVCEDCSDKVAVLPGTNW